MLNRLVRINKNSELGSLFLILLLGLFVLSACKPVLVDEKEWIFSGPIMGTQFRVVLIASNDLNEEQTEGRIRQAMEMVNQAMSTYIDSSELNQFNRLAANQPMTLSMDLNTVVTEALAIAELTKGAFDPTIGPAVNLWGFGPQGRITKKPSKDDIAELRQSIGYKKLNLRDSALVKTVSGVTLDLSAIAKGFAVDKVAEALLAAGIQRFLVDIGGELRASGTALSGEPWRVAIEKPHIMGGVQQVLELHNQAIATSGDYRNYILIDGQAYSHTISADTLEPVFHRLASVSVITERSSTGDALATALMAMGDVAAKRFVEQHDLSVYMLIRQPGTDQLEVYISDQFNANLQ